MAKAKATASETLKQLIQSRKVHGLVVGNLLEALMNEWGGFERFANSYHTEYVKAREGGIARQRMLDGVLRLFTSHTANLKGRGEDLSSLSTEDLERVAASLLRGEQPQEPANGPPPF